MNKSGEKPDTLVDADAILEAETEHDFESNVTGVVDLPKEKRKKRSKGRKGRGRKGPRGSGKKDGGPKSNRNNKNSNNRNKGNKK
jgi:hypothetical protein